MTDPGFQANHVRALNLLSVGRADAALETIGQALATEGVRPELLRTQAECYLRLGRDDEAKRAAEWAVGLAPDDYRNLVCLSRCRAECLDLLGAVDAVSQALAGAPTAVEPRFQAAELALLYNDFETAEHHAAVIAEYRPGSESLHNLLGRIAMGRRDFDAAHHHFSEALRVNPTSPRAMKNLNVAMVASGKTSEAADLQRRIVAVDAAQPESVRHVAWGMRRFNAPVMLLAGGLVACALYVAANGGAANHWFALTLVGLALVVVGVGRLRLRRAYGARLTRNMARQQRAERRKRLQQPIPVAIEVTLVGIALIAIAAFAANPPDQTPPGVSWVFLVGLVLSFGGLIRYLQLRRRQEKAAKARRRRRR